MEIKHNDQSRHFMQQILLFIDSVIVNAINSEPTGSNKILTSGLLNVRDAIFSEIVRDSQVKNLDNVKKNQQKEEEKTIKPEKKSDKDQQA
jgi:hypothetical protein